VKIILPYCEIVTYVHRYHPLATYLLMIIRTIFLYILSFSFLAVSSLSAQSEKSNSEKAWENLLEGNSLKQWKRWRAKGGIEDASAWTIEDGVLHLSKARGVEA